MKLLAKTPLVNLINAKFGFANEVLSTTKYSFNQHLQSYSAFQIKDIQ